MLRYCFANPPLLVRYCSATAPLMLCYCSVTVLLLLGYWSQFLLSVIALLLLWHWFVNILLLLLWYCSVTSMLFQRYCSSIAKLLLLYTGLLLPLHVTSLLLLCCWSTTALLIICYCSKRWCTVASMLLLWVSSINRYIKYHNLKYHINDLNCGEGYEDMIDYCSYTHKAWNKFIPAPVSKRSWFWIPFKPEVFFRL